MRVTVNTVEEFIECLKDAPQGVYENTIRVSRSVHRPAEHISEIIFQASAVV